MISASPRFSSLVLIASLVACGGGGGGGSSAPQHLYVGDNAPSSPLFDQFTLPLATTSTPTVSVAETAGALNAMSLAVDGSGNVVTGSNNGHLSIFSPPFTSSSTPANNFNNGASPFNTGQLAFGPGGKLFASDGGGNVNIFNPPLIGVTVTASSSVTDTSLTNTTGVAFDASGNLYVANQGTSGSTISVFAPPYTSVPTVTPPVAGATYRKIAISGSRLFVGDTGTTSQIDVYTLPLATTSAPAFSIGGVDRPEALSFDGGGNLYVGSLDTKIRVFAPPISASSTPSVTFSSSVTDLRGIVVGN